MKKAILATLIASSLTYTYSSTLLAEEVTDTMVVTANRVEQSTKNLISPAAVVTKEEIQAIQAKSLTDVLRRLPGVQVSNSGGAGQTSSVYIRGTSSKHTLVLIDGVRFGSATTGYANFSAIPLSGIERVELIRGPRAAVYGSDAIGGVINIITSPGNGAEPETIVDLSLGSDNYQQAGIGVSTSVGEKSWINISANYEQSDGYNISANNSNPLDADDDGYKNNTVMLSGGSKVTDSVSLSLNAIHQNNYSQYDNPWGGVDQSNNDLYNISGTAKYNEGSIESSLSLGTNEDKSESYGQGTSTSTISTKRNLANWNNLYQLNESLKVGAGVDWYNESVNNTSTEYTVKSRSNTAGYLLALYHKNTINLESNVRVDDNEQYGSFTSWQLGGSWEFIDDVRLSSSVGTAFKAPTFNELYWPLECGVWGCYSGNPELKPEESENFEVALSGSHLTFDWRVAAFQNKITNLISSNGTTNVNLGKAEIKGIETAIGFTTGDFIHDVSYDYLDTKDKDTGFELQRRAKHSAKWNTSYLYEEWQFDVSYLYQGKRYDDNNESDVLDAYSLVDFAINHYVTESVTVKAKIANLFDEHYETAKDYITPERNYYLGLSYLF